MLLLMRVRMSVCHCTSSYSADDCATVVRVVDEGSTGAVGGMVKPVMRRSVCGKSSWTGQLIFYLWLEPSATPPPQPVSFGFPPRPQP